MKALVSLLLASTCAASLRAELTLDEAVRVALSRNPAVSVENYTRQIARARVTSAAGQFDPSLRFARTRQTDETPTSLTGLWPERKTDLYDLALTGYTPWGMSYSVGATALNERTTLPGSMASSTGGSWQITQPLLKGFGPSAALAPLRLAKADRRLADEEFRRVVVQSVTDVIIAYQDVLEARELLRISTAYRDNVVGLVTENQRRNEVGSLAEADVANARSRAAQVEEGVIFGRTSVRTAENRLRRLLGETEFETAPPLELAPLPATEEPVMDAARDLATALAQRPEASQAREEVRRGELRRSLAVNSALPQVDLIVSQGYRGLDDSFRSSRAQVRDRDYKATSAGIVVQIPLTHATARGDLRATKLGLLRARTQERELEADISAEITNAILIVRTAGERVRTLREAQRHAKRSLEAEVKRLRAGTGQTFFVLQQQGELAQVESSLVRALADQRRAIARYQQARGTLLKDLSLEIPAG